MPFRVIAGRFFCVNYSPDGDTIRFGPDNLADLDFLDGVPAEVNRRGHASIRLEGIDALETHYERRHQPLELALRAREALLGYLGIRNIVWDAGQSNVVSADDGAKGYVIARSSDKYGRVIAFAFPGDPPVASGSELFVEPAMLDQSANFMLLAGGLAYPTYYWTLFAELRNHLTARVVQARAQRIGIHAVDVTTAGFDVPDMGALTDRHVIMPKLFRRASTHLAGTGSIAGFKDMLAISNEPVLDLRTANFTHFDTFVEEDGDTLRLTRLPEELVFDPMPERPGGEFNTLVNNSSSIL